MGVQYDEPVGKNDGSVKGQRYFSCDNGHGVFRRQSAVEFNEWKTPDGAEQKEEQLRDQLAQQQEQFEQLRDSFLTSCATSLGARCASAGTAEIGALLLATASQGKAAHTRALLLHALARGDAAEGGTGQTWRFLKRRRVRALCKHGPEREQPAPLGAARTTSD